MIRVCAWCGLHLGNTPDPPFERVSHGMCPVCHARELIRLGLFNWPATPTSPRLLDRLRLLLNAEPHDLS